MPPKEKASEDEVFARNGDKLRDNDHVYFAGPWEPRQNEYHIARIMEFLPADGQPITARPLTRARINHYHRVADTWTRQGDIRCLYATTATEIVPISCLRQRIHVSHRDKIANLAEWRKTENCFYYHKYYHSYLKTEFEIILSESINNVPQEVKDVLRYRYEFVIIEKDVIPELTCPPRICVVCNEWCPFQTTAQCARCNGPVHWQCVDPPITQKPGKGWGWTCVPCDKRHAAEVEQHGAGTLIRTTKERKSDKPVGKPPKSRMEGKDGKEGGKSKPTGRATRYWKRWPYRYFGLYTVAEDTLDSDDFIFPVLHQRHGIKYQTPIPALGAPYSKDPELPERGSDATIQILARVSTEEDSRLLDEIMLEALNNPALQLVAFPYAVAVLDEVLHAFTHWQRDQGSLNLNHVFNPDTKLVVPWKAREVRLYDTPWTPEEQLAFDEGISHHFGNLQLMHEEYVPTKTRPEIVRYFAAWKNEQLGRQLASAGSIPGRVSQPSKTFLGQLNSAVQHNGNGAMDEDSGSEIESPHRAACGICKTKDSARWWKAPRAVHPPYMCNNCSNSWRKYKDWRIVKAIEEAQSRALAEQERPIRELRKGKSSQASKASTPLPLTHPSGSKPASNAKAAAVVKPVLVAKPLPPRFCVCCKATGPGETIARCHRCLLTLHPACAGFPKEEWQEPWTCDICVNEESPEASLSHNCLLCPVPTAQRKATLDQGEPTYCRAMKPTEGRGWVHVMCAVFTPEVQFNDAAHMKMAEGVSLVPTARWRAQCVICNIGGAGACIKCSDCPNEFHLSCAWLAGCTFGFEIAPVKMSRRDSHPTVTFKKETGVMNALVWCHAHDRAGRTVYGLGEVDPKTGLTAMQTYCRAYKQVPLEGTFSLLRKAHRLDTLMAARTEPTLPLFHLPLSKCRTCGSTNSPFFYPDPPERSDDAKMDVEKVNEDSEPLLCHACYYRKIHAPHRTAMDLDEWEEDESDFDDED